MLVPSDPLPPAAPPSTPAHGTWLPGAFCSVVRSGAPLTTAPGPPLVCLDVKRAWEFRQSGTVCRRSAKAYGDRPAPDPRRRASALTQARGVLAAPVQLWTREQHGSSHPTARASPASSRDGADHAGAAGLAYVVHVETTVRQSPRSRFPAWPRWSQPASGVARERRQRAAASAGLAGRTSAGVSLTTDTTSAPSAARCSTNCAAGPYSHCSRSRIQLAGSDSSIAFRNSTFAGATQETTTPSTTDAWPKRFAISWSADTSHSFTRPYPPAVGRDLAPGENVPPDLIRVPSQAGDPLPRRRLPDPDGAISAADRQGLAIGRAPPLRVESWCTPPSRRRSAPRRRANDAGRTVGAATRCGRKEKEMTHREAAPGSWLLAPGGDGTFR
jgi:hypothetical protein